ncbi:hypothetical protein MTO96_045694 [Rhipicephalus appendiculatus]
MIYFVVGVTLLLQISSPVRANGLQINGPECGMPTRGMIVNGTAAQTNQFPWMVYLALVTKDDHGHACAGEHPNQTPHSHRCALHARPIWTTIIRHHKYTHGKYANDIAVLQVEKPFQYGSNARPICIPAAPMNVFDTETMVAGWGTVKEGGQTTNHLQYTTVRVLPNELCSVLYFIMGYVSDVMYCAYRKGTNACHGDSGGPLMSRVVGGPLLYTRLETFTPWLRQVVGSFDKAYSSEVPLQLASYTVPLWPSIFHFL